MTRLVAMLSVLAIAGCAGQAGTAPGSQVPQLPQPSDPPSEASVVPDGYQGRFRAYVIVLENEQHGPQLCAAVQESLPPQCSGPDIVGWSWDGLTHESAQGTKWGDFTVIGTWDGTRLTLTEKATTGGAPPHTPVQQFTSPCKEPEGGWKVLDSGKATDAAMQAANQLAQQSPDYAGLWIDQSPGGENDPTKYILNVRFTKDLDQHEAELRSVWGGKLCVSPARHTLADLERIQNELTATGVTDSSVDVSTGTVAIGVWVAYEQRQREVDDKYGAGVVKLLGALKPID